MIQSLTRKEKYEILQNVLKKTQLNYVRLVEMREVEEAEEILSDF
ncbi:MAG: hypothetical protein N4A36_01410 [Candidatus Gracilibacteria bacterium]|jgi:hypothetical protein|nr:hypothetical protein [Candidatus Gracilibacteria bacterium]